VENLQVDRIPLSDESAELDDDVVDEEVGTVGAEEQYKELDFDQDPETEYEPWEDDLFEDEDDLIDLMEKDL
jgi:hypothetical protein